VCLIIDNDVVHRVLLIPDDQDFCDLHASLWGNRGVHAIVVYGGKLLAEYQVSRQVLRKLAELDRAGRARRIPSDRVDEETARVIKSGLCISNDSHVVALARVSDVRLLCSNDKDLHEDFMNKRLIEAPRGKVYKGREEGASPGRLARRRHTRLLAKFCN
jgi:hypothetical protein